MPMQENTYSIDILAVQRCIELAVRCVEADPVKRPSIMDVVDELNKLDADMKNISLPCQVRFRLSFQMKLNQNFGSLSNLVDPKHFCHSVACVSEPNSYEYKLTLVIFPQFRDHSKLCEFLCHLAELESPIFQLFQWCPKYFQI